MHEIGLVKCERRFFYRFDLKEKIVVFLKKLDVVFFLAGIWKVNENVPVFVGVYVVGGNEIRFYLSKEF